MIFIKDVDVQQVDHPTIGAKAKGLFQLSLYGGQVPRWVVLPADFFAEVLVSAGAVADQRGLIRAIENYRFPSAFLEELDAYFGANSLFAVRSSSLVHDGSTVRPPSGIYDNFIGVSKEELLDKVRAIWKSMFTDHALRYAQEHRLSSNLGVAIIIQEMLLSEGAGAAFSINPLTGVRQEKYVSASFGVGGYSRGNVVERDTYTLRNGAIKRDIVRKKTKVVFEGGRLSTVDVSRDRQFDQVVSDDLLWELDRLLDRLHDRMGVFYEVEFAHRNNELYLLQAYPMSGLETLFDPTGFRQVWNSKQLLGEVSGVTTPLTFSILRELYTYGATAFATLLGVKKSWIERNESLFADVVGFLNGRIYSNMRTWYAIAKVLPSYSVNPQLTKEILGISEDFEDVPSSDSEEGKWNRFFAFTWRSYLDFNRFKGVRLAFKKKTEDLLQRYRKIDLKDKDLFELTRLYLNFEKLLIKNWEVPIRNQIYLRVALNVLRLRSEQIFVERPDQCYDLLQGRQSGARAKSLEQFLQMVSLVKADEWLSHVFARSAAEEVLAYIEHDATPAAKQVKRELYAYLEAYGQTVFGDHRLESLSYHDDPRLLVEILQEFVNTMTTEDIIKLREHGGQIRQEATAVLKQSLRRTPVRRFFYGRILRMTDELVREQEDLDYYLDQMVSCLRQLFVQVGKRAYEEGVFESERDVFFLSKDEVLDFVHGRSVTQDLRSLIAVRREDYDKTAHRSHAPQYIETFGVPYQHNDLSHSYDRRTDKRSSSYQGIGYCDGILEGEVVSVAEARRKSSLGTGILVLDKIKLEELPCLKRVVGVILGQEDVLHPAVLAIRYFGIPCVVGLPGVVHQAKQGLRIRMDGRSGAVELLS